jgi:hypothetical protein
MYWFVPLSSFFYVLNRLQVCKDARRRQCLLSAQLDKKCSLRTTWSVIPLLNAGGQKRHDHDWSMIMEVAKRQNERIDKNAGMQTRIRKGCYFVPCTTHTTFHLENQNRKGFLMGIRWLGARQRPAHRQEYRSDVLEGSCDLFCGRLSILMSAMACTTFTLRLCSGLVVCICLV